LKDANIIGNKFVRAKDRPLRRHDQSVNVKGLMALKAARAAIEAAGGKFEE